MDKVKQKTSVRVPEFMEIFIIWICLCECEDTKGVFTRVEC